MSYTTVLPNKIVDKSRQRRLDQAFKAVPPPSVNAEPDLFESRLSAIAPPSRTVALPPQAPAYPGALEQPQDDPNARIDEPGDDPVTGTLSYLDEAVKSPGQGIGAEPKDPETAAFDAAISALPKPSQSERAKVEAALGGIEKPSRLLPEPKVSVRNPFSGEDETHEPIGSDQINPGPPGFGRGLPLLPASLPPPDRETHKELIEGEADLGKIGQRQAFNTVASQGSHIPAAGAGTGLPGIVDDAEPALRALVREGPGAVPKVAETVVDGIGGVVKAAGLVPANIPPAGSAWAKIRAGRQETAAAAARPLAKRLEDFRRTIVRKTTDRAVDLNEFQKDAQRIIGRPLRADEQIAELARMNPEVAAKVRVDEELRPLVDEMGDDLDLVSDLLIARSNVDQATVKGAGRKFSGGVSGADSSNAITELQAALGPRYAAIEKHADAVTGLYRKLLEEKVAAGLVTREAADDWLQKYPNYVKTEITDYLEDAVAGGTGAGQSLSVRSNGIKRLSAEGTERQREDPIATLGREFYRHERLVKQNTTFNAFDKIRAQVPGVDTVFAKVPNGYSGTNKERTVTGFVNGERVAFMTSSPEMARVIKMEGTTPIPYIGPAMQLFKELITSKNPAFLVGNAMIDAPLAFLRETVRAGGPQHAFTVGKALIEGYADAFKGLRSGTFTGDTAAYLKAGGGMGGAYDPVRKKMTSEDILADLGRVRVDLKHQLAKIAKLEPVADLGGRVELGPRVAAFKLAQRRGETLPSAVAKGRTVTVDFAEGGSVVKTLNQVIPFLNPSFQGVAWVGRMARDNPRAFGATVGTGLVAPTLMIEAWNRADPQRERDYEDVPQYLKDRGWVIMLPTDAPRNERGEREPQFIPINLRTLAPFTNLTREVIQRVAGKQGRGVGDFLWNGVIKPTSPVTSIDSVLPPGIGTTAEQVMNRDMYRGTMIETEANDDRASALSRGIGDLTGIRPSRIEHATRDVGGFAAQAAHGASDLITGRTKESGTPQDIPVAGAFIRRAVRGDTGQRLEDAQKQALWTSTREALKRAKIRFEPSPVRGEIDGAPLRKNERERYQKIANRYVNEAIHELLRDPSFRSSDALAKEEELDKAVAAARRQAKSEFEDSLDSAAMEARAEKERRRKLAAR